MQLAAVLVLWFVETHIGRRCKFGCKYDSFAFSQAQITNLNGAQCYPYAIFFCRVLYQICNFQNLAASSQAVEIGMWIHGCTNSCHTMEKNGNNIKSIWFHWCTHCQIKFTGTVFLNLKSK